jgi:putative ABC transport system permease protein
MSIPIGWRYAIRSLRRNPIFTVAAVLTLALAIGANTAIFSVIDALLLRGLPYPESRSLVMVWQSWPEKGFPRLGAFRPLYFNLAEQSRSFAQIGGYQYETVNLSIPGRPERLQATRATSSFFQVLAVPAEHGRTLTASDDVEGSEPVAVLSHQLWNRLGHDPAILGHVLPINGMPHTVVGVMPDEFRFSVDPTMSGLDFRPRDIWLPLRLTPQDRMRWTSTDILVIGRLKPGETIAGARAEADIIRAAHDRAAGIHFPMKMRLEKLTDELRGDLHTGLGMLLCAVGCVLVVACVNVANLLLARDNRRRSEFALRAALGAGKWQMVRQALIENLILALMAGVVGVGLAAVATKTLTRWLPPDLLRAGPIATNLDGLLFATGICVLAVFVFGLGPAVAMARGDVAAILRDSTAVGGPRQGKRFRELLVVGEITVASCLMMTAVLLGNGLHHLQGMPTGFEKERAVIADTALLGPQYADPANRLAFFDRLTQQVGNLPGVEDVGIVDYPPFGPDSYDASFQIEGHATRTLQDAPMCVRWTVSPGYRAALGIPLLGGRWLLPTDDSHVPLVAVIDEVAAKRYWPAENPIGRRVSFQRSKSQSPPYTIVGVVGGIRHNTLDAEPRPGIYVSFRQATPQSASLVVRSVPGARTIDAAALRMAMRSVDAAQPLDNIDTLEHLVRNSTAVRSFQMWMMVGAALLAAILSSVGIYGVMACHVSQRTPEIGLRMALGARGDTILRLVLFKGILLTAGGTALGLVAATVLGQGLRSRFYGVELDWTTLALGFALVWISSLLACAIPAARAARMQPLQALRLQAR